MQTVRTADREAAARGGRSVDHRAVQRPIMQQHDLAAFEDEVQDAIFRGVELPLLRAELIALGVDGEAVGAGDDL
jgi:hypothetical protein